MVLEDDDFLNLDDLSGVAGARSKGLQQVAEMVAEDRRLRYFDILRGISFELGNYDLGLTRSIINVLARLL